ncbi:stage II sporulation protein M [Ktedonobacter racemifer]|uniref:Stage II sporulation protein M n=1 Tax=Ktedonobacter racemifer DSM 44963 TaxID=485913 RepID=D6TW21_KTERA|nr:protein of unknown function DUF95 transmembrane [Ktedonobacter racemifer DSM 44963]
MTVHLSLHENVWEYIGHNLQIELLFLLGAVTFDVGTLFLLIFNGVTGSIFATAIALHYGVGFLLRGLLPHGVPETLAWLFIATCSFFMGSRLRAYFFQRKEESTTAKEQAGKGVHNSAAIYIFLLFMATLLILLVGFLEAYVSPHLI